MSSRKAIVTRPEFDKVTSYLSEWCEEIILLASEKGIKIKDLGCENVTRKEFEKYMKKQKPTLVIMNGHGKPDRIGGHKNEVLVIKGENEHILKNKIVYALSCHSAEELGKAAIEKGTTSYIGYNRPFCFLTNKNKECTPEDDELANNFKEASNKVPISLVNGKPSGVAYRKSQDKFRELIIGFGSSDALPEAKDIRFWLFWNMRSQVLLGEENAVF